MRCLIILAVLMTAFASYADGQTTDCPPDKVCLTQQQAAKYLALEDEKRAIERENLTLKQAVLDQKEVTVDVKIELAKQIGEKTGAQSEAVRLQAIVDFLLKNGRKKCGVFSICIQ
jgi:hypothetical protein